MKLARTFLLLGAALLVGACGHEDTHDAMMGKDDAATKAVGDAKAIAAKMGVINVNCPVTGDPVEAGGGSVQYAGNSVGFCCKSCVGKFEKLDDKGKVAALAEHGATLK